MSKLVGMLRGVKIHQDKLSPEIECDAEFVPVDARYVVSATPRRCAYCGRAAAGDACAACGAPVSGDSN